MHIQWYKYKFGKQSEFFHSILKICTSNETVTTVPSDQVLIITDIVSAITYDSDTIHSRPTATHWENSEWTLHTSLLWWLK